MPAQVRGRMSGRRTDVGPDAGFRSGIRPSVRQVSRQSVSRQAVSRQVSRQAGPGRDPGGGRRTYLTLPAVSPPTRRFSMSMNRMTTGRIATIDTPNTYCQLVSYCPTNLVRATDSG